MTVKYVNDGSDPAGQLLTKTNPLPIDQNIDKDSLYEQIRPEFPDEVSHDDWTSWIQDSTGAKYYNSTGDTIKHQREYMLHHIGNIKSTLDTIGANSNFGAADYLVLDKLGYSNANIAYMLDSRTLTGSTPELHYKIKWGDPKAYIQKQGWWKDAVDRANRAWPSVNRADQNAGGSFGNASSRFIKKRNEWYNGAISTINTHNQNTENSANALVDIRYNQNLDLKTKNTALNNYDTQVVNAVNSFGEGDYLAARDAVIKLMQS